MTLIMVTPMAGGLWIDMYQKGQSMSMSTAVINNVTITDVTMAMMTITMVTIIHLETIINALMREILIINLPLIRGIMAPNLPLLKQLKLLLLNQYPKRLLI